MKLLGIELTLEEFDYLMCEQAKGKELKVVDGKLVAVEHESTESEIKQARINEIQTRLNELSQDFIQADLGAVFDDLEQRQEEFKSLHNELRSLLGKEPRTYIKKEE